MRSDLGNWRDAGKKIVDRLTVAAHVGVIYVSEDAQDALAFRDDRAANIEFNILGARAAEVRVKMNAVRDFGHQAFGKADGPAAVVILEHSGESEAPRVRSVIVGPVVVDRPVHELKIGVRTVIVVVEEVGHAEFAETNLQSAHRQPAEQGKWRAHRWCIFRAKGNNLVPNQ